jgi:hypothetical protein
MSVRRLSQNRHSGGGVGQSMMGRHFMGLNMRLLIVIIFVFLPFAGYTQTPIPLSATLPIAPVIKKQINLLKQMENEINASIKTKQFKEKVKDRGDDSELVEKKSLYADSEGRIRAYSISYGDGDMAISTDYFYDETGKLRVVVNHFGHYAIGTQDQTVYLDSNENILRVYLVEDVNTNGEDDSKKKDKPKPIKKELQAPETMPYSGGEIQMIWNPKKSFAEPLEKNDEK